MSTPKHIAVLLGGWSAEREVSLVSGAEVAKACEKLGYRVTKIDVAHDVAEKLKAAKPDVAFNALHGRFGEDGCIQGVLEVMEIPYTHSGVMASALAMDKPMAKKIFECARLPLAKGRVCSKAELLKGDPMKRPYVVKPANEGSSVGVRLVFENDNFFFSEENWSYGESVLVEEYIAGRELTSAVLDDQALGVTEIRPKAGFYDYKNKYTEGKTEHLCPAPLSGAIYKEVTRIALAAHQALGCRGLSRSDLRYDEENGRLVLLEVNTQPGMTPLSLAPEMAQQAGISFEELVDRLIKGARLGN